MQQMSSKKYEQLLRASELFDGHCHQFTQEDSKLLASDEVKLHLKNWALIRSSLRNELPQQVDLNFADKVMAKISAQEQDQYVMVKEQNPDPQTHDNEVSDLPSMLVSREAFANAFKNNELLKPQDLTSSNTTEQDLLATSNVESTKDFDQANVDQSLPKKIKRIDVSFINLKRLGVWVSQVAVAAAVAVLSVIGFQTYNASEPVFNSQSADVGFSSNPINGISLASYQAADSESMIKMGQIPDIYNQVSEEANVYQADIRKKQQEEIDKINQYIQGYVFHISSNNYQGY